MTIFVDFIWPQDRVLLPQLFSLLAGNMSVIAPTGNTYEQDYAIWSEFNLEDFKRDPDRKIILIWQQEQLIGYFQYRVRENVFRMEEIQFHRSVQGHGIFRLLYGHLLGIPEIATAHTVWANVNKRNTKSMAVLTRLGLRPVLEREHSFHYVGDMAALKAWYYGSMD